MGACSELISLKEEGTRSRFLRNTKCCLCSDMFYLSLSFYVLLMAAAVAGERPRSWAYVLQAEALGARAVAVEKLKQSGPDWLVLDQAYADESRWQRAELDEMRAAMPGRKVLCYLSIGEAESYRPYWQKGWRKKPPVWLATENPVWPGNFRVKYWHPQWQQLMLSEVRAIQGQAGFDGFYWDIVDGFEFWEKGEDEKLNLETGQSYRQDMVQWLQRLADEVKKTHPRPLLVAQNGVQLVDLPAFSNAITHLALEGLFYDGQRSDPDPEALQWLPRLQAFGKPVLCIEYVRREPARQSLRQLCAEQGWSLLLTDRALKTLGASF
jgi:cysteinyl-tRNA synthetase, unknown class